MVSLYTVEGHLGKDPVLRTTQNGTAFATGTLAYNSYRDQESTLWVNYIIFGESAKSFAERARKGSRVLISGRLCAEEFQRDGRIQRSLKLEVRDWSLSSEPGPDRRRNPYQEVPF